MSELAGMAIILGSVTAMIFSPCVIVPSRARKWITHFPRHKWTGRVLAGIDLAWAARLIYEAPLGRFDSIKPFIWVLAPLTFFLVITLMDELLATRSAGGLFLLVPAPLLAAAALNESCFAPVIVVVAYALVIIGIVLVLSPYQFRKSAAVCITNNGRCRACGAFGLALGVFLILLGLAAF